MKSQISAALTCWKLKPPSSSHTLVLLHLFLIRSSPPSQSFLWNLQVCVWRSDLGRSLPRSSGSRLSHLVAVSALPPPPAEHDSRRSCCLDISCYLIKMTDDNESHRRRSSIDLHIPAASHAQIAIHKHVPIKQSIRRSQIYSLRQCYVDALTADLPECEPAKRSPSRSPRERAMPLVESV